MNLISLLAGLSLFLYGITLMGDGLNLVAGNKLEVFLYRLTSNRFRGILLGTLVTAVIQSSSATSVMCVGFVSSGLMRFAQAVAVILGSILGTSITGWMLTLSSVGGGGGWVELLEELIDGLCDQMRSRHIDRLQMGISTQQHGFVFNDLITNYERVGDHCSNVAVAMIELSHDVFDTHEYLDSLKIIRDAAFDENYEHFRAKYSIEDPY